MPSSADALVSTCSRLRSKEERGSVLQATKYCLPVLTGRSLGFDNLPCYPKRQCQPRWPVRDGHRRSTTSREAGRVSPSTRSSDGPMHQIVLWRRCLSCVPSSSVFAAVLSPKFRRGAPTEYAHEVPSYHLEPYCAVPNHACYSRIPPAPPGAPAAASGSLQYPR